MIVVKTPLTTPTRLKKDCQISYAAVKQIEVGHQISSEADTSLKLPTLCCFDRKSDVLTLQDIKMHILLTVLHTFLMKLVRRICLNIKTFYPL